MGHAFFGLLDEYTVYRKCDKTNHMLGQPISITNGTSVTVTNSNHAFGHWIDKTSVAHAHLVRSCPSNGVACIMDGNVGSEFCVAANHVVTPTYASAQQETNNAPCWVTMKQKKSELIIPANLPLAGPGSSSADSTAPLPWDQNAARHVKIIGP